MSRESYLISTSGWCRCVILTPTKRLRRKTLWNIKKEKRKGDVFDHKTVRLEDKAQRSVVRGEEEKLVSRGTQNGLTNRWWWRGFERTRICIVFPTVTFTIYVKGPGWSNGKWRCRREKERSLLLSLHLQYLTVVTGSRTLVGAMPYRPVRCSSDPRIWGCVSVDVVRRLVDGRVWQYTLSLGETRSNSVTINKMKLRRFGFRIDYTSLSSLNSLTLCSVVLLFHPVISPFRGPSCRSESSRTQYEINKRTKFHKSLCFLLLL